MILFVRVWVEDLEMWYKYALPYSEETFKRLQEVEKESKGSLVKCSIYNMEMFEMVDLSIALGEFEQESFTIMARGLDVEAWDQQGPSKLYCLKKRALVEFEKGGQEEKSRFPQMEISKLMRKMFTTTIQDSLDNL